VSPASLDGLGQCDPGGHRGASRVADISKERWLGTGTTPSFAGPIKRARAHSHQDHFRSGPGVRARSQDDPQTLVEARDHISAQRISSESSGLAWQLLALLPQPLARMVRIQLRRSKHRGGTPHSPPRRDATK
jgi:hypothetical protein